MPEIRRSLRSSLVTIGAAPLRTKMALSSSRWGTAKSIWASQTFVCSALASASMRHAPKSLSISARGLIAYSTSNFHFAGDGVEQINAEARRVTVRVDERDRLQVGVHAHPQRRGAYTGFQAADCRQRKRGEDRFKPGGHIL